MQRLREEIHAQEKKMNNEWVSEELFQHLDCSGTLQNMDKIKDLRTLLGATQARLTQLKKEPSKNEDLILQEKVILSATRQAIERLKKDSFPWRREWSPPVGIPGIAKPAELNHP